MSSLFEQHLQAGGLMNNNDNGTETTDVRPDAPAEEEAQVASNENSDLVTPRDAPSGAKGATVPAPHQVDEDNDDRSWAAPIAIGVFSVVAIAIIVILLLTGTGNEEKGGTGGRSGGRGGTEQADWKVTSYSLGGKHPSGKHGKPPKALAKSLEKLVRRWHDSVYLFPAELRSDTQRYFSDDAARAVRASTLGLPNSASKIETKRRSARIGIEADGAKRAAAVVDIVATGDSARGAFRVGSETQLWLERRGSNWKVIAFDVGQQPLPLEPKKGQPKKGQPKKGQPKKGEPKKGQPKKGEPKKGGSRERASGSAGDGGTTNGRDRKDGKN